MIPRRLAGLVILALIIIIGLTLYILLKRKVDDVESDLTIAQKKDLKGKL